MGSGREVCTDVHQRYRDRETLRYMYSERIVSKHS